MYRSFHAKPHGDATLRAGFVAACIFIAGAVNTASAAQALTPLDVPVVLRGDVLLKTASDVTDAIARAYGPLSWSANSSGAAAQLRPDLTIDGKLRIEGDTLSDAHLAPFLQLVSEVRGPLVITDTTQVRTLDSLSRLSKAPYIHLRRNAALFSACGLAGLDPSNPPQMITVFGSDSTVELPTLPTAVGTRIGVYTGCNGRSSTSPGESRKPEALPSSAAVDVVAPVVRRRRAQHEAESCFVDVVTDSTSAGGTEGENVIYINFYGSGRKIPKPSSVAVADTVEADTVEADTAVAPASKVDLAAAALEGCKQQSAGDDCTELTQALKEAQAQEAAEAETLPPSDGASVDGSLPPSDGASVDGSGGMASEGADEDDGEAAVEQAAKKKAVEDATKALDACEADKTKCDSDKEKELQKVLKSAQENVDNDKLAGKTDTEKAAEDKAANKKELADATKALKDYEAACKTDTANCDSDKEKELKGAVDVAQEKVDKDAEAEDTEASSSKSSGDGGMVGLAVGIVVFLVVCVVVGVIVMRKRAQDADSTGAVGRAEEQRAGRMSSLAGTRETGVTTQNPTFNAEGAGNEGCYEPISQEGGGGQEASAYAEFDSKQKYSGPNGAGGQGAYQNVNDGASYAGLEGGRKYGAVTAADQSGYANVENPEMEI